MLPGFSSEPWFGSERCSSGKRIGQTQVHSSLFPIKFRHKIVLFLGNDSAHNGIKSETAMLAAEGKQVIQNFENQTFSFIFVH